VRQDRRDIIGMTELLTGWNELILAFALFFLSHIIPVRPTIREWLIRHIGKATYLAAYSMLSIIIFVWLIVAVGRAPYLPLWQFAPWQKWIPNVAMPFVCLLLAFGMVVPNPLSIASCNDESFDPDHPGIAGVTRHPVLWAAALWAIAHMVPNGDLAHVLLFGLFGAFSIVGMLAIDARKQRMLGAAEWRRLSHRTSQVPLAALVGRRWRPSLGENNLFRLIAAVALYAGLLALHQPFIGVSPFPPL
jgi:uncharacterized membrane protein